MPKFGRCSICTDGFGIHNVTVLKGCGHTFHLKCITLWLNTKKTCPNCRKKALEKDVAKLFIDDAERTSTSSSILVEDGSVAEALRDEIERERESKQKLLDTLVEMQEQRESLLADLAKERDQAKLVRQKEEHIRGLEAMLSDQGALQRELDEYKRRLRASELWFVLNRNNDDGSVGEREIDKLLGREGDPDSAKFLGMLKSQLSNLRQQYKKLDGEHAETRVKLEKYKRIAHNLEQSEKRHKEEVMELRKKCVHLKKRLIASPPTSAEYVGNQKIDLSIATTTTLLTSPLLVEEKSFGFSFNEGDANFGLDKTRLLLSAGKDTKRDSGLDCEGGWDPHDESETRPKHVVGRTEVWEGEDVEIPASVLRRTQKLKRLPSSPIAGQPKKNPAIGRNAYTAPSSQQDYARASSPVHEASFNFSIEQLSPRAETSKFRVTLIENEDATKKGCQQKPVELTKTEVISGEKVRKEEEKRKIEIIDLC